MVKVAYEGADELGDQSKNGLGTYEHIGNVIGDGSAIYARSEEDGLNLGRSIILRDWQGNDKWIGTVTIIYITMR